MPGHRFADDLESRARELLPDAVHRYIRQGARDSVTTGEATAAWDAYRLLPKVLRDVTDVETRTSLLGTRIASPFAVAPTTLQRAAHPEGELATARAAAEADALMVLSSNAGSTFAEVAATGVAWWLQLYLTADRTRCLPVLDAAVRSGARAIVLTVDTPVVGTKFDDGPPVWESVTPEWLRVNFPADHGHEPGHEKATDLGPQDVEWLHTATGLPVVVKGVLSPADARRSVDAGASAVWVSNHGGRQLDYAAATADCLTDVAAAVGEETEVYVDGGVRCGRHGLVAAALGARAFFVGRPVLWALAVGGAPGVSRLLQEMQDELVESLRLSGCGRLTAADRSLLHRRRAAV